MSNKDIKKTATPECAILISYLRPDLSNSLTQTRMFFKKKTKKQTLKNSEVLEEVVVIDIQMVFSTSGKHMTQDSFGLKNWKSIQEYRHACKSIQIVFS